MRRKIMVMGILIVSSGTICLVNSVQHACAAEKEKRLRVGVYDSRGIAIAYANSHFNDERYQAMKAQLDIAEAAGDEQKIEALKEAAKKEQAKIHFQGFGTAPVHDYLEVVKDKIPAVAKDAGVDMIVSKWETDYLADNADVVDVTTELAKLFEPSEKACQWIEQMKDIDPIPAEEIERLEKEDPNF